MAGARHVYHIFCVRVPRRDELIKYLGDHQVYTGIHYPIPCHQQNAYAGLGYKAGDLPLSESYAGQLLSLPMSEMLKEEELLYVCETIKQFYTA